MRVLLAALALSFLLPLSRPAGAEPVNLLDATPRWVDVVFEVSPRNRPAQTDTIYTHKIPARLEVGAEPGQAVVTIDRSYVEAVLFAGDDPVSGSFSDYVWIFDTVTGDVVSASLSGTLTRELDWGFFNTRTRARVESQMVTRRVGGVKRPRSWLGQQLFEFCDDAGDEGCRTVAGRRYDAASGYVYAVGALVVKFNAVKLRTFSPLGEAIFSEREITDGASSVAGGVDSDERPPVAAVGSLTARDLVPLPTVSAGPPLAN